MAERALLPGDPGRALRLAQALLETPPAMLNHNRGLWGYTGIAADGAPLTIQSTGTGGPSAVVVVEDLIALGARRLVRVGTCGALDAGVALGALVAANPVIACDGASRALGAPYSLAPDPGLGAPLAGRADATGPVVSVDLLYAEPAGLPAEALAREMEAAAVLAIAAARGAAAACVLLVVTDAAGRSLDRDAVLAGELELGSAGAAAFGL